MASWKCQNCGYTLEADASPNQCPSCLVHHSIVLELNLTSYRLEHSKKAKEKKE